MDNAACDAVNGTEAARILRELADEMQDGVYPPSTIIKQLRDINGNIVGTARVTR